MGHVLALVGLSLGTVIYGKLADWPAIEIAAAIYNTAFGYLFAIALRVFRIV